MNKNKRNLIPAIMILISLISLSACKSDNTQAEVTTTEVPVTESPTTEPSTAVETPTTASPETEEDTTETPTTKSGALTITFDFEKQSGYASNQFAVWIEDVDGDFIKTLYATNFTASGGYESRPDSISVWVHKSDIASKSESEVDTITGATPGSGTLSYTWDLTDEDGNTVPFGEYNYFVEGTMRWKNYILYTGTIEIGDEPTTSEASAEFVYEASDNQEALTDDADENSMIGAVTASYVFGSDQ